MEVESEDEDDGREDRNEGQPSQPDQDTQVQDMDEVRADEVILMSCILSIFEKFYPVLFAFFVCLLPHFVLNFKPTCWFVFFTTYGCQQFA